MACQCIDLSWDKIFVEQNTLKVKLIYLPLSVRAFDSYVEFESELRTSIVKLVNKVITTSNTRLDQLVMDLCNGSLSLEDVYNKSRGAGTAPIEKRKYSPTDAYIKQLFCYKNGCNECSKLFRISNR